MFTPTRAFNNKDEKLITPTRDRSEHTPTRSIKPPENSIFGGNDDLPDSMRFTTTYR